MLFVVFALIGCTEKAPNASDQELNSAIRRGAWPNAQDQPVSSDPLAMEPSQMKALGAYRYTATTTYKYNTVGAEEGFVAQTSQLVTNAAGHYHLTIKRSFRRPEERAGTSLFEAIYDGSQFHTRLRENPWVSRNRLHSRYETWHKRAVEHLPVLLRLLGKTVKRQTTGRTIRLSLGDATPIALPRGTRLADAQWSDGPNWFKWWAQMHRPTAIDGQVVLHPTLALVTQASLTIRAQMSKQHVPNDQPNAVPRTSRATFEGHVSLKVEPLASPPSINPPAETDRSPKRQRVQHMIDEVLGKENK